MLNRNLNGDTNLESTNKYMKFGQLIIRKIIQIIATRCHSLRLKCTKLDSGCLSVCLGRSLALKSIQTSNLYPPTIPLLADIFFENTGTSSFLASALSVSAQACSTVDTSRVICSVSADVVFF